MVLALVGQDGETHWMEGVMLLAVYVILALAFYHLGEIAPPRDPPGLIWRRRVPNNPPARHLCFGKTRFPGVARLFAGQPFKRAANRVRK